RSDEPLHRLSVLQPLPNIFGANLIRGQEQLITMQSEDDSLDAVYDLLSESRRRYVLYYFLDNEHANIEGLSLQIAAWEQDVTITGSDMESVIYSEPVASSNSDRHR
ncbi:hypothetical protein RBH26_15895, partial [Natronolimnohabitans sp. A-GB9]|nr:hypothetical protein [Natronolimnohabitans sp. A-GB9]